MSSYTYMKFYEDEYRTLEITIRDMDEAAFIPDTATCIIKDNEGNVIGETIQAMVVANVVKITVPTTVTAVKGTYNVLWTLIKDTLIYKHKTILSVEVLS